MKGTHRILTHLLWVLVALTFASCDNIVQVPTETTDFSFSLSAVDPADLGGISGPAQSTGTSLPLDVVQIEGELLVVSHDGSVKPRKYQFTLEIDPALLQVVTVKTFDLPTTLYDFYFLLKTGANKTRYGGHLSNIYIVEGGTNLVKLSLDPLIGITIDSVEDLQSLSAFGVKYDDVSGYVNPRLVVKITSADGTRERVLSVHNDPKNPEILFFQAAGEYAVDAQLFDGSILKQAAISRDLVLEDPTVSGSFNPIVVKLEPTTGIANLSFEPDPDPTVPSGVATLIFTIPDVVVDEVGGLPVAGGPSIESRLQVNAAIVGPDNPLREESLTLDPELNPDGSISHYSSTLSLDGFTPGRMTWTLTFNALNAPTGQIGYCTGTVADTATAGTPEDPFTATLPCPLVMLHRSFQSDTPAAGVHVLVTNMDGLALPGAVVRLVVPGATTADPPTLKELGITMDSSDPALAGTLDTFLKAGGYDFQAVYGTAEPSAVQHVNLVGGIVTSLLLQVPFFVPPPPPPLAVQNFTAEPGDGVVTLNWSNPNPVASIYTTVRVYRFESAADRAAGSNAHFVTDTTNGHAVDGGLNNGQTYYYSATVLSLTDGVPNSPPAYVQATPRAETGPTIRLVATRHSRPTVMNDGAYDVEEGQTLKVRIPPLLKPPGSGPDVPGVEVIEGNPSRFLLQVRIGHVTCFYLGGKWDRHFEGVEIEDWFRRAFKSPMCLPGDLHEGDVVTVHGSHSQHPEISTRVVAGDSHHAATQVAITLEVVP
jgi:hypothetical protein